MSRFDSIQVELGFPKKKLLTVGENGTKETRHLRTDSKIMIIGASVDNSGTEERNIILSFLKDGKQGTIVSGLSVPNINTVDKPETILQSFVQGKFTLDFGQSLVGGVVGFVQGTFTFNDVDSDIFLSNQVYSDIDLYNELAETGEVTLGSGEPSNVFLTLGLMYID